MSSLSRVLATCLRSGCLAGEAQHVLRFITPPAFASVHRVASRFSWSTAFNGLFHERRDKRHFGEVEVQDEFSWLRTSAPDTIVDYMLKEQQALNDDAAFKGGLHKQIYAELVEHQKTYAKTSPPVDIGGCTFYTNRDDRGNAQWLKREACGTETCIISATEALFEGRFDQIVDVKLNERQDKAAVFLDDGRHPEACTVIIKPLAGAVTRAGEMRAADELEAVHTLEWLADGQHVVYSRVGAGGVPAEVWLHRVGAAEGHDRMLYEEESEGFHVHVNLTADGRWVTISSVSKASTEVHLMDAADAESGPEMLQDRDAGLLYWVTHAHGLLIVMHNGWHGPDYDVAAAYPPTAAGDLQDVGLQSWCPLVARDVGAIADVAVHSGHLVLFTRERGRPRVRAAPWSLFGVRAGLFAQCEGGTERTKEALQERLSCKLLSDLPVLPTPEWATTVERGAAADFHSPLLTLAVSSPTHPEEHLTYDLAAGSLRRARPGTATGCTSCDSPMVAGAGRGDGASAPQGDTEFGVNLAEYVVESWSVPVKAEPSREDYLLAVAQLAAAQLAPGTPCSVDQSHLPEEARLPDLQLTVVRHRARGDGRDGGTGGAEGAGPVVIRAYGAYGLCSDTPFDPDDLPLLQRGITIVTAHVRGGGEHGRAFHTAGIGLKKWASLYDYSTAIMHLIRCGAAQPGGIAIDSFSAGSLIAGHVLNEAPGVFAAALMRRPFVTLLQTMTDPSLPLTVHEYDEWGHPDSAGVAAHWQALCPHSNVRPARYPPMLITTGLRDTRVEWWGPVKYAWRLRQHQESPNPILLHWGNDGHFVTDPRASAVQHAFILHHLQKQMQQF